MSDFEFSGPAETKAKRGASAPSNRRPAPATMVQAKLPADDMEKAVEPEAAADPTQNAEKPKKPKYDPEELAGIFDEIIFSGEYSEEVTIRGKLKIRLRTRTAEEVEHISMVVDSTTANLVATLAEKRSILNLQYALSVFNGRDLSALSVEDKAKYVKRLPGPVVGALLEALSKFDAKVYAACQEGEENF